VKRDEMWNEQIVRGKIDKSESKTCEKKKKKKEEKKKKKNIFIDKVEIKLEVIF
jgi:hypothetical protein